MPQPPTSARARLGRRILAYAGLLLLVVPLLWALALAPLLFLGMIDVEATLQSWIRPQPAELELQISWDEPEHGFLTVTNLAASAARDLQIRIVEDYTYADSGIDESKLTLGDLAPGDHRTVSYGDGQAERQVDIGALKVWLTCDRGTAFTYAAWSYAY